MSQKVSKHSEDWSAHSGQQYLELLGLVSTTRSPKTSAHSKDFTIFLQSLAHKIWFKRKKRRYKPRPMPSILHLVPNNSPCSCQNVREKAHEPSARALLQNSSFAASFWTEICHLGTTHGDWNTASEAWGTEQRTRDMQGLNPLVYGQLPSNLAVWTP